jgi:lipopolysaccharide transport system ATP-binding protein
MSCEIAIRCEGLSKQYRIGQQERYKALRDVLTDAAATPFRRLGAAFSNGNGMSATRKSRHDTRHSETIWALDDVSFEVKQGEVVGIIGRNGAGKSTLLKILSRITKPTKGHAEIHGRVGSLLEVGTGFHPELTGRENLYLNGAILGMRKAEIDRKFDEIVAFAEVEKFIDTPVKRYSSGMQVRLAFAVAAHMETEILLVDEVLAVGDVAFQKKCMGKMGDVVRQGRTVFFVSHNMAAVQSLCPRGVLLDAGRLILEGDSNQVIEDYLTSASEATAATTDLRAHPNRHHGCERILSSVRVMNSAEELVTAIRPGDELVIEIDLDAPTSIKEPTLGIGVDNAMGARIFSVLTHFSGCNWPKLDRATTVRCSVPSVSLVPGRYLMSLSVGNTYNTLMDAITHAASFSVEEDDYFGSGRCPTADLGVVLARSRWEFKAKE